MTRVLAAPPVLPDSVLVLLAVLSGPAASSMVKKAINLAAHACWKLGRWTGMEGGVMDVPNTT